MAIELTTSELTSNQGLVWAASSFCALGAIAFVLREKASLIHSRLFLPIYTAGILQWMLFGFFKENFALIVPTGIQLLALGLAFPAWVRSQRRRA